MFTSFEIKSQLSRFFLDLFVIVINSGNDNKMSNTPGVQVKIVFWKHSVKSGIGLSNTEVFFFCL